MLTYPLQCLVAAYSTARYTAAALVMLSVGMTAGTQTGRTPRGAGKWVQGQ